MVNGYLLHNKMVIMLGITVCNINIKLFIDHRTQELTRSRGPKSKTWYYFIDFIVSKLNISLKIYKRVYRSVAYLSFDAQI